MVPALRTQPIAGVFAFKRLATTQAWTQIGRVTVDKSDGLRGLRFNLSAFRQQRRVKDDLTFLRPEGQLAIGAGTKGRTGFRLRHTDPELCPE